MLNVDAQEFGVGHTYDVRKGDNYWHGQFTEVFCSQPCLTIPALPTGAVTPYSGTITTPFTYAVNFYSRASSTPTQAQVVIDDAPHDLTLSTGVAAHGTYRYTTTLPVGKHTYHFVFQHGQTATARWPETGSLAYPRCLRSRQSLDAHPNAVPRTDGYADAPSYTRRARRFMADTSAAR